MNGCHTRNTIGLTRGYRTPTLTLPELSNQIHRFELGLCSSSFISPVLFCEAGFVFLNRVLCLYDRYFLAIVRKLCLTDSLNIGLQADIIDKCLSHI